MSAAVTSHESDHIHVLLHFDRHIDRFIAASFVTPFDADLLEHKAWLAAIKWRLRQHDVIQMQYRL